MSRPEARKVNLFKYLVLFFKNKEKNTKKEKSLKGCTNCKNFTILVILTKTKKKRTASTSGPRRTFPTKSVLQTSKGKHRLSKTINIECRACHCVIEIASTDVSVLRFCRTWTKRHLVTSQTRCKRVSRIYTTGQPSHPHHPDFSSWRPVITFPAAGLFLPLLLRLTSFLSQNKTQKLLRVALLAAST